MKGLKNYKGERDLSDNKMHLVEDSELLIQQLQNFLHINEGDCPWDIRHGLSRRILYSTNDDAIKSEIRNKVIEYYGDRVLNVTDMTVNYEDKKIIFTGKISTIYGEYEIGGARWYLERYKI